MMYIVRRNRRTPYFHRRASKYKVTGSSRTFYFKNFKRLHTFINLECSFTKTEKHAERKQNIIYFRSVVIETCIIPYVMYSCKLKFSTNDDKQDAFETW